MSSSAPENPENFPRLPSGALDRSRICVKERQAYEQCHGGSFLQMLQRMGESLSGGSMEAETGSGVRGLRGHHRRAAAGNARGCCGEKSLTCNC